jgi:hypothetical protein
MSDYTKTTNFTAKDNLSSGNALKVIKGSYFDTEFDNIATANATKFDTNDIASQAEAEAEASNTVVMTPGRLAQWADYNGGMVGDIQALADPNADVLLGWDDSASAAIGFTLGAGLSHTGTELNVADAMAGAGLTVGSSILAVGAGNGITVNANDVALTDVTKGAGQPLSLLSGTWDFDITALSAATASASLAGTESIILDEGGTSKKVALTALGLRVQTAQTSQTLAAADMNTIMQFSGTYTLTLPNSTLTLGAPVVVMNNHATLFVTIALAASAELESVFHPGSAASVSDRVSPGGTALIYQTASGKWKLSGDIVT